MLPEDALRQHAHRLEFLDNLGKETADSADAGEILSTTTRMLGCHLDVAVCAYADMDEDGDGFTIRGNWSKPGHPSIVGHYSLSAFGKRAVHDLNAGAPLILSDNQVELPAEEAATFLDLGLAATICMPLVKRGKLIALMAVHDHVPRAWTASELTTVTEVTQRSWAHIERVRLMEDLRASEARYRGAAITGRIASWETDMVARTRVWTEEGMALFGLSLLNGRGQVGGENDEFKRSLHPEDKHKMEEFHRTADKVDSYPCEYRISKPDGSVLWVSGRGRVVRRGADGKAQLVANMVADITERKQAEEHIKLLMREVSHRSKNLLAVVQAIASQTIRTSETLEAFGKRFVQRLQGLAASQDLLVQENWRGVRIEDLAREQLIPFVDAGSARLTLRGAALMLKGEAVQAVGLALHELATNATKYGAWVTPIGHVSLTWAVGSDGALQLKWVERGGPRVEAPMSKGFGQTVIENMVALAVEGSVEMRFDPDGLTWSLSIPASNLATNQ
jgi:PAS domain S-box-containing protein